MIKIQLLRRGTGKIQLRQPFKLEVLENEYEYHGVSPHAAELFVSIFHSFKAGIAKTQCWNDENTCRSYPVNTKHLYNIYTISDKRLRRWSNIVQNVIQMFRGLLGIDEK